MDINLIDLDKMGTDNFEDFENSIEEISSKDIAIVGVSINLPGASDIKKFWDNMRNAVDCVTQFPQCRKQDVDRYMAYKKIGIKEYKCREGAYLGEIDKFDHKFFNLSPREASLMDPNQRLFLQTAWEAIEDSGYGSRGVKGTETGVYVGYVSGLEYKQFISEVEPSAAVAAVPGNIASVIAGRISYMLDLRGPSVIVDTACSSSLVAVHMACMGLRNGECDMALAGSIKLNLLPLITDEKLGIESSDGRTKAFDDSSDGTGVGEGVIAVLLKPLSKAVIDGDRIYAVIKGSAVNQDGKSIGLTAPNAAAQERVIIKAWKDAGIDPETISYIETHGTGTKLGDPIEIEGITGAFRKYTKKTQFCAIGALKTNIGHLDNAAGIAGMLRAILALNNKEIPPILHFKKPNSKIDFEQSPVYINTELTRWEPAGFPRRCGVSAFGLSGTNCHVILEEAPIREENENIEDSTLKALTISAKTIDALGKLIGKYAEMVENGDKQVLEDICYTAVTGRGHYEYRLALILKNKKDFQEKIKRLLSVDITKCTEEWFFYGECKSAKDSDDEDESTIADNLLKQFVQTGRKDEALLSELLRNYVSGADVDWDNMYRTDNRKKAEIPVYQFEKIRCWIEIPELPNKQSNINKQNNTNEQEIINEQKEINQIEIEDKSDCEFNKNNSNETATTVILKSKANIDYTDSQIIIAQVWGTALGYKEIDIDEDFYELGGDSIIAASIANKISKQIGAAVSAADILEYTTIQELSDYIDTELKKEISLAKVRTRIEPVKEQEYYIASSAQKRLYILGQLKGIDTCYNMPGVMTIEGILDKDCLDEAFNTLVKRHETLRTSFKTINGEIVQIIHDNIDFAVKHSKAENFTVVEENIRNLMKYFVRPFDLENAPLLRVELVEISENRHIMLFDMHHIISDGTSMAVMVKEIIDLYDGKKLPDLRIQYKDFSHWQNKLLQSGAIANQEQYWVKRFEGEIPVLNLPCDYHRPQAKSFEGDRFECVLNKELSSKVNKLAKESGTTLYMILMAAFNILLSKYTGQRDIILGSAIAGRTDADLEKLIGMFVNILPMRNYVDEDKSFSEFLYTVRDTFLEAFANQDYQFDMLVEKLNPPVKQGRNPIFDVAFVLQNMKMPQMKVKDLMFIPYKDESKISKSDIAILATEEGEVINFIFEYCTSLFKSETIERLAKDYIKIIKYATENIKIKIKDIVLVEKDEENEIASTIKKVEDVFNKLMDEDFDDI